MLDLVECTRCGHENSIEVYRQLHDYSEEIECEECGDEILVVVEGRKQK